VPGVAHGFLRLVETREAARALTAFDPRAFAIDLFTRDIERSLEVARDAGGHCSKIADHEFGPIVVREAEVHGPDGLVITLLHLHGRRPSVLDRREDLLHSEVHSFVYSVHDIDRIAPFWQETLGLRKVTDARFGGTSLSIAMGLEEREISARFVVFTDAADQPVRVQLIEFLAEGGHPAPSFPLHPGLHAVAFEVDDLPAAMSALSPARFGASTIADGVLGPARAVTGCAPGDLRFELWERAPATSA
jgi:catechol 2,3-dioxygenase-like lactoylglutathione lyase family enzyme